MANPSLGHRAGAEHAEQVLSWCETVGIKNVTVFICSTENGWDALSAPRSRCAVTAA